MVPWLFGWTSFQGDLELKKTFDVALHMGTFLGGLAYFAPDIARYLRAWFRSIARRRVETTDERLAWFLVIATLPGVLVGAVAEDFVEEQLGRLWLVATMLGVFGVILYLVDRAARRERGIGDLRLGDALLIGLAQAMALQPGVSRSGVTITMARGLGLERAAAARFSFLLSLPIIAGAGVLRGVELVRTGFPPGTSDAFVWGTVASAVSGFLVIWGLLAYLRRRDFAPFVVYRLVLAALVLGLLAAGIPPATGG